jgi:hypothetical protein
MSGAIRLNNVILNHLLKLLPDMNEDNRLTLGDDDHRLTARQERST